MARAEIENQADWILKEIGVEFRGDEAALTLFRGAGASVSGARVRFDPGLARQLCRTAPTTFPMRGRDPAHDIVLGGDHVVFMPGYGAPLVTDLDRGRRYATLEDFRNLVRLSYASLWLHHTGGTACERVDRLVNKRRLDMVHAHMTLSTKPFMGGVTAPERAEDSIALAQLVRPGCPFVFGSFHSTMNLKSGALPSGAPEANLIAFTLAQLGRRLGVLAWPGGGQIAAANAADGRAMQGPPTQCGRPASLALIRSGARRVGSKAG